jgi:hypothetical protein
MADYRGTQDQRQTQKSDVPKESPERIRAHLSSDSGMENVAAYLGDLGGLSRNP